MRFSLSGHILYSGMNLVCLTNYFFLSGAEGLKLASRLRKDSIEASAGSIVHLSCQKRYTDKKDISLSQKRAAEETQEENLRRKSQRSLVGDPKLNCVFCSKPVSLSSSKHAKEIDGVKVRTDGELSFVETVKNICYTRQDEWAISVLGRLEYYLDLHAANVLYHKTCSTNFRTGR